MKKAGSLVKYKNETWRVVKIAHDYLGTGYILKHADGSQILVDGRNSHEVAALSQSTTLPERSAA